MITTEDIEKLTELSKLKLSEGDREIFRTDLEKMVDFIGSISLSEVSQSEEPMDAVPAAFREDEVKPSLPREEILKNAKSASEDFFLVREKV